jgi:cytochrome c oxidase cbb3-type subunit IV
MYKEVLRSIEGVEIFPVVSFVIFGLFFVFLLIYVLGFEKQFIIEMKNSPLDDNTVKTKIQEVTHE